VTYKKESSTALNFPDGLFLTFLGLKLSHSIDWSWWWVCAPLIWSLLIVSVVHYAKGERA
jgi:hypothetical protein